MRFILALKPGQVMGLINLLLEQPRNFLYNIKPPHPDVSILGHPS
jgi:hypothetical protein